MLNDPSRPRRARWRGAPVGLLQVSAAGVLWGTGGLANQIVRAHTPMSVATVSAWRMGIAAVVLVATVLVGRHLPALRAALRARPGKAAFVGSCTAAYQALYFWAVVEAGVTVATVVSLGLAPLLLTLWESRQGRPTGRRLLVLAAALTGLALTSASAHAGGTGPRPGLGVLLAGLSGTSYAIATQVGRPLAESTPPLILTTMTTTVGAVVLAPLAVVVGGPWLPTDGTAALVLLYLGVMTMALAYALLYAALRTTSPSSAVIATLLEPVTAAIVAAIVLGERVGALGVLGIVLVLIAVAGLGERVATPPEDEPA